MKKILLALAFCVAVCIDTFAQTKEDRNRNITAVNRTQLQSFQGILQSRHVASEIKVEDYLKKHPLLKRSFVKGNSLYYLKKIDEDGYPVYINTKSNVESGALIKADQLYTGGSIGVNITGQNMVAGIWDGGQVRATHELLSGQVAMQAGQTLSGIAENYKGNNHQTHVSGTMVGKDIANQRSARGIAYGATAQNYDWENDETEMVTFATNGFLISNHSYGYANDNTVPVWKFGAYDSESRNWDVIAKNAPFYLPFVAAGNEQQSNGNTAKVGYDLITGSSAAKNVMTVGAVNADKTMSSYSNWGPTDDGRVKPDIVARGTGINSSTFADPTTNLPSDNSYSGDGVNSSGTSYSTPAVAAAGLLLQQYYKSLYGNYMKAATLKALMLGTAEDLGQPGPDYKFGWGLLNVEKAAKAIKSKSVPSFSTSTFQGWDENITVTKGTYIEEITYNLPPYIQTDPNRLEMNRAVYARGGEPLVISMAWTDEEGTAQVSTDGTDPTTSRLVHEYDMLVRIFSPFSDVRPWQPSGMANRTANATVQTNWFQANNNNYKQVIIPNPVAGAQYVIYFRKSATSPNTLMPLSLVITGTALAAPLAYAQTRCAGQTVANLVANTGTGIKWYNVASGGTALASTTPLVAGNYYATQTIDGIESLRTGAISVTINNNTITPSVGITTRFVCAGTTATLRTATTNGGQVPAYAWQKNNVDLGVSTNFYTVTNAVAGDVYTVTMTPSAEVCPNPATATASRTISPLPAPPVTNPVSYNVGATAVPLTATASANSTLLWYGTSAAGGTSSNTAPTPPTNNAGLTTYYVSQRDQNTCESTRASLVVTVNGNPNTPPAPTGVASQTFCAGKTVADLAVSGNAIQWYGAASGGSTLPNSTVLVNGTVYYATQTISGFESTNRLAVTPTVNIIPTLTIGTSTNPTLPNNPDGSIAFTTNLPNATYSINYSSTGNPQNVTVAGGAFTLSGLISGIYGYFSVTRNGCTGINYSTVKLGNSSTMVISLNTGNWESSSTWNVGRAPQAGDVVTIDTGHTVTINGNGNAKDIEVRGFLKYATTGILLNLGR